LYRRLSPCRPPPPPRSSSRPRPSIPKPSYPPPPSYPPRRRARHGRRFRVHRDRVDRLHVHRCHVVLVVRAVVLVFQIVDARDPPQEWQSGGAGRACVRTMGAGRICFARACPSAWTAAWTQAAAVWRKGARGCARERCARARMCACKDVRACKDVCACKDAHEDMPAHVRGCWARAWSAVWLGAPPKGGVMFCVRRGVLRTPPWVLSTCTLLNTPVRTPPKL
jgi:hypothetical protein